jgi:hypothetical protein
MSPADIRLLSPADLLLENIKLPITLRVNVPLIRRMNSSSESVCCNMCCRCSSVELEVDEKITILERKKNSKGEPMWIVKTKFRNEYKFFTWFWFGKGIIGGQLSIVT